MPRIVPSLAQGSQLEFAQTLWGPLYESVLDILGTTATILPFGDPYHGQPDATTFTTVGEEQVAFTWSKAPDGFDTGLDLRQDSSWQGIIPVVKFDGVDEEADSPDAAYWSRVAGAFSVGAWINVVDATTSTILAKYDAASNIREWIFHLTASDVLRLILFDESAVGDASIDTTADVAVTQNVWVFAVGTYDGSANATGISVYQDGAVVASTDTDDANFVNLEDLTSTVKLAHFNAAPANLFDGTMAGGPLGPFFVQTELGADAILRLYEIGRRALGL